jgi:hypothetical protein
MADDDIRPSGPGRRQTVTAETAADKAAREARLAQALRANLGRRKAQSRARAQPAGATADPTARDD